MKAPFPEYHSNPETSKQEPVYIFTDKAIVRPPKDGTGPQPNGPETEEPPERDSSAEGEDRA